jgi:Domain of unknown function (DUF4383)
VEASRSPAQIAALVLAVWWLSNGIGALLIDPNFSTGNVHGGGSALGVVTITVNGWHALLHLIPGLIGIAIWRRPTAALAFVLASGAVYVILGAWGLLAGGSSLGPIAVDPAGDVIHMVEGFIALAAGLLSLRVPRVRLDPTGA